MGVIGNPLKLGVLEKRVKDMVVGEKGFIEYGAICFVEGQILCLNLCANVYSHLKQKIGMPIKRAGKRKNDYLIDLRVAQYKWSVCEYPFGDQDWDINPDITCLRYNLTGKRKSRTLLQQLISAVKKEDYERAAAIRDMIRAKSRNKD